MKRLFLLAALLSAPLALAACDNSPEAPADKGVCFEAVQLKGKMQYNEVARSIPNLETCAARLEAMRLKFLSLGGNRAEIVGVYQGQYLFLQNEGVFVAQSLTAIRYPALVRTGDGRLAIPGAVQQPPR